MLIFHCTLLVWCGFSNHIAYFRSKAVSFTYFVFFTAQCTILNTRKTHKSILGVWLINCKEMFKTNVTWSSREVWRRCSTNKKGIGITRKQRLEKGNHCLLTTACLLAEFGGKTDMLLQLCEGPGLLELSVRVSYIWDRLISLCHICLPPLLFAPLVNRPWTGLF